MPLRWKSPSAPEKVDILRAGQKSYRTSPIGNRVRADLSKPPQIIAVLVPNVSHVGQYGGEFVYSKSLTDSVCVLVRWPETVEWHACITNEQWFGARGARGGGGECSQFVHGRSRMTIDPRIPTMSGRSTSGCHEPGRRCLHQARIAVRCSASRMTGELPPSKNRS